jgi:hypothetical protein
MFVRFASVGLAALVSLGACGGATDDASASGSGLPSGAAVSDLTRAEAKQLCDWFVTELGGTGARYPCDSVTIEVEASSVECVEALTSCSALVSDVEACASEQRAVLEGCRLKDALPACDRLDRLCSHPDDEGTRNLGSSCIPGQALQCTCADGRPGAQECTAEGELGPCQCGPEPPGEPGVCAPGETLRCACADGASGTQRCEASGDFGPCACPPPPPQGSCNATFCPSTGSGEPCCVGPDGPCGADLGNGCVSLVAPDGGL